LKQNRKATLELFVEKADELRKEDFTQFIEEFGHQLSYQYTADPQQLTMTTVADAIPNFDTVGELGNMVRRPLLGLERRSEKFLFSLSLPLSRSHRDE